MRRVEAKQHIRTRDLGIAVLAAVAAAVLSSSCFLGTKTTLCEASGLRCKPGQVCAAEQGVCINIGGCGDGLIGAGEACDDGNIRDGDSCSADCTSDETCGNGVTDEVNGESCDGEPNCNSDCQLEECGNSIIDINEDCDNAGMDSRGCNSDCTFATCGDTYQNSAADEECDDGINPSSTCNSPVLCKISRCGDSYYNPADIKEECDTGGDTQACNGNGNGVSSNDSNSSCHIPNCGDSYTNTEFTIPGTLIKEECDTGGTDSPTCDLDCTLPICGDNHINFIAGEKCDDGNPDNDDLCVSIPKGDPKGICKDATCGDGYVRTTAITGTPDEDCDTAGDSQDCDADCTTPQCGDGHINLEAGEVCEPGGSGCESPTPRCVNSGPMSCKACQA